MFSKAVNFDNRSIMADQSPSSNDIQLIFRRLRSLGPNKVCFDCSAKNPTWASVTYGVFICIDCSAVHRSLGVHLTFVRSTQLDTNWTWLQIRQMQLGGNGNAQTFFQQHNCTTKDAQQKYNSRAAQLYKEKLHNLAIQAIRTHGTKVDLIEGIYAEDQIKINDLSPAAFLTPQTTRLHIESHDASHGDNESKEVDFFEEHQTSGLSNANDSPSWIEGTQVSPTNGAATVNSGPQPNVDAILTNVGLAPADSERKSTITQRKPIAKKTGLGAKKGGLGAQRVKTNFADIEEKAAQADKDRERAEEEAKVRAEKTVEEEQKQLATMRLAYQDLSQLKQKEEDKLRNTDPKKAQQLERLGMGFASKSGVSHSVMTDMKVIEQDAPVKSSTINLGRSLFDRDHFLRDTLRDPLFDDRDDLSCTSRKFGLNEDRPIKDLVVMLMDSNVQDDTPSSSSKTGWESCNSEMQWDNKSEWDSSPSPLKSMSLSSASSSRSSRPPVEQESGRSALRESASKGSSATSPTTAQQKFGSAKAISSDQYFSDSTDQSWERKANLSRFEGSSSISSADFFNGDSGRSSGAGSGYSGQFVTPDLEDVKESVRQGVTKVAGKLSSLANGVVSTIQERYGNY